MLIIYYLVVTMNKKSTLRESANQQILRKTFDQSVARKFMIRNITFSLTFYVHCNAKSRRGNDLC